MHAFFAPFEPVEEQALCVLATAKQEVLAAHYNIYSQRMIDALIALHDRGVTVRVAVDQDNAAQPWNVGDDVLEQAGIPVARVSPSASGIMHLKSVVVDGSVAMSGSFNWNNTAAQANDENMVVIADPLLVARYRAEVLEVLGDTPRKITGGIVASGAAVHFSPKEHLDDSMVAEIDRAQATIDVAMYTFTMKPVVAALERAAARGVHVRAVLELKQCDLSDADERLEAAGALVVRAANEVGAYSAMHQKYGVFDGHRVITGASNWTQSGTRVNDEDVLVLDDEAFAAGYRRNFADLLWVYGGLDGDDASTRWDAAPILFHTTQPDTQPGDRVLLVGDHPLLGSWSPAAGVELTTATDLFPTWSGRVQLPLGAHVAFKLVTVRASGAVEWEPGPNREIDVPANGRAAVFGSVYGDTARNFTPRAQ
jgi:phosphatidylserine/phosphatidylglycerophosphate/cardiolipin synthase-like enzyme